MSPEKSAARLRAIEASGLGYGLAGHRAASEAVAIESRTGSIKAAPPPKREPFAAPGLPEGFTLFKLLTRTGRTKGFEVVLHGRVVCVLGPRATYPALAKACRAFEGFEGADPASEA